MGSLIGALKMNAIHYKGNAQFRINQLSFPGWIYMAMDESLCKPLGSKDADLIEAFSNQYIEALKHYCFIGGMPEAVLAYNETKDLDEVRKVHNRLLFDYEHDFSKHATPLLSERIRMLWNSTPAQLGRENKKFIYSAIKKRCSCKRI